jgi:hypothetical protein
MANPSNLSCRCIGSHTLQSVWNCESLNASGSGFDIAATPSLNAPANGALLGFLPVRFSFAVTPSPRFFLAGALFSLREEGDESAKRPPCGRLCLPEDVKSRPAVVPGLAFLPSTADLDLERLRPQGEQPPGLENGRVGFESGSHALNRGSGHF